MVILSCAILCPRCDGETLNTFIYLWQFSDIGKLFLHIRFLGYLWTRDIGIWVPELSSIRAPELSGIWVRDCYPGLVPLPPADLPRGGSERSQNQESVGQEVI